MDRRGREVMISKSITFLVDETTNIGKLGDVYWQFGTDNSFVSVSVDDAAALFLAKGVKIPAEFAAVREKVQSIL